MATEQDPLICTSAKGKDFHNSSRRRSRCCPPTLRKRYKNTCVTTRGSLVALLWSAVVNTLGVGFMLFATTQRSVAMALPFFTILCGYYVIALLLYPVAALVGELRMARFTSLLVGSVFVAGVPVLIALTIFSFGIKFWFLLLIPVVFVIPGLAFFQSNILQYGSDQLDFASSEVHSSFVYWYYWTCYLIPGIVQLVLSLMFIDTTVNLVMIGLLVGIALVWIALFFITVCCCCCNPEVRMDRGDHLGSPVKLIWRVWKFARRNKNPVFRSAFTYNEMPSLLDLAKQRYGGPFTTWEVEDVKSFWQLLLLLLSLIGFQLRDDTTFFYVALLQLDNSTSYFYMDLLHSCWTMNALVIIVSIPIYQLIIRPFFSQYIPRMLKRMKLGLMVEFLSLLMISVCSGLTFSTVMEHDNVTVNSYLCSVDFNYSLTYVRPSYELESPLAPVMIWLILIPQALNGLSHMLVFLTAIEFIFAQAPHRMQGFLIGLWYAMQSVNLGISIASSLSCAVFEWEYYAVKSFLVLLSIGLFVAVSRRYKYRKLNEDIDVNIQQHIEDVFERDFDRKVEFERQQELEDESILSGYEEV